MDGATTGKIEGGELKTVSNMLSKDCRITYVEEPAVGVPGPASNGAVDDGSPAEAKQNRRDDATTLKGATNQDLNGASADPCQSSEALGKGGGRTRKAAGRNRRGSKGASCCRWTGQT